MKIFLLYSEVDTGVRWSELLGVGVLGAMIRQARHNLALVHFKHPVQIASIEQYAAKFDPDLVVGLIAWDQWPHAQAALQAIRRAVPKPMIVAAGVYPTLDPQTAIEEPAIDAVLVGEIETALMELIQRRAMHQNCTDTLNFWFKSRETGILKNGLRPLIGDLDIMPFSERTLFDHAALVQSSGGAFPMLASRGCPYNCQFCYMPRLKQISSGKGPTVRMRGVKSIAAEVLQHAKKEPVERVEFVDEYFPSTLEWLSAFCANWKEQVGLPFRFTAVAENLSMENMALLRDAGCDGFRLGIETGDEKFRSRIADRNLSNQRIEAICEEARRLGMHVTLHAMTGLPLENPELAQATLDFVQHLQPNKVEVHIFDPIVGTPLHQFSKDHGYIKEYEGPAFTPRKTSLRLPSMTDGQVLQAYDSLRHFDLRVQAESVKPEANVDLIAAASQARVEASVQPAMDLGWWSHEQDARFCIFQVVGSRLRFPVELRENACLQFGLNAGPWPYGIRFPHKAQVEVRIRQGETEDILFVHALAMTPGKGRRGWFDVRLPLVEWSAGPAEIELITLPMGALPLAPVYVAWAQPRIVSAEDSDAALPAAQAGRKILMLEEEMKRLRSEKDVLESQMLTLREDLDQRKKRVGELHVQTLEMETELNALREEKKEWTRLREEIEGSMGGKIKRLFKKD